MDDRRSPNRPHPAHASDRVSDEPVVAEAPQEFAVVVVCGEDEAEPCKRLFRLRALDGGVELSVRLLGDARDGR